MGLISSIVNGIVSSSAHDKTTDELNRMASDVRVPEAVRRGEAILREQAGQGLPGYEQQMDEIDSSIPLTLNQAKDYVSSGGLIDALSKMYAQGNKAKRELSWQNDKMIMESKNRLAEYLGRTVGGYENEADRVRRELQLGGISEDKSKAYDQMFGVNTGINSLISGLGGEKGILEMILNSDGKSATTPAANTGMTLSLKDLLPSTNATIESVAQQPISLNNNDKSQLAGLNLFDTSYLPYILNLLK